MTLRKTFEGDLKKMELTWGTAKGKQKRDIHGEKGVAALSLLDRRNQRRRRCFIWTNLHFSALI